MVARLLLDTHVVLRWIFESRRLSRTQTRALERVAQKMEPVGVSAMSLLEIAALVGGGRLEIDHPLDEFFGEMQANPFFRLLPLSYEVALESASLGMLKDPADRAIVATARVHRLQVVTSDQRIIDSRQVAVID